jgi:hypothetical protein
MFLKIIFPSFTFFHDSFFPHFPSFFATFFAIFCSFSLIFTIFHYKIPNFSTKKKKKATGFRHIDRSLAIAALSNASKSDADACGLACFGVLCQVCAPFWEVARETIRRAGGRRVEWCHF